MLLSKKIKISGMQCDSCESRIAGKVRLLDGVISAQADQHKGLLRVYLQFLQYQSDRDRANLCGMWLPICCSEHS